MPGSEIVNANLTIWTVEKIAQCHSIMSNYGSNCEAYARTNASWYPNSDSEPHGYTRTGAAREGLSASTVKEKGSITTYLSHSVDYGQYLELRYDFGGRFKILEKSIEHDLGGLMGSLQTAVGGVGGFSLTTVGITGTLSSPGMSFTSL
jgi:hypothetical protein